MCQASKLIPEYEPGDKTLARFASSYPTRQEQSLDRIRIVERDCLCRSEFSRLFSAVSIKTQKHFDINCRSWRCLKHREKWGRKWGLTIAEMLAKRPVTLLINLTTSEMIDNESIVAALRFFIRRFRDFYGPTQYVKVVEYNKKKTQPHFHLLVCCEDLKIPAMPPYYRNNKEGKKLSWPYDVFSVIRDFWEEALNYAAPEKRSTTVVWCQPPSNSAQATNYALGYITGKSTKDEEPDSTWKGRKLTYSKAFFDRTTAEIWAEVVARLYPAQDPEDKFYWRMKEIPEPLPLDDAMKFANSPIMVERWNLNVYYSTHGKFPVEPLAEKPLIGLYWEVLEDGQETFIPELDE